MRHALALLALAGLVHASHASAMTAAAAEPRTESPAIESRVMHLSNELRCLVCQNQSLADSNADLAVDLRNQIRTMAKDGRSDAEIVDFMVQRYGDFVLYRPPLKLTTMLLWAGPFVLMIAGLAALFAQLRRRRAAAADEGGIDVEARRRAAALLERGDRETPAS